MKCSYALEEINQILSEDAIPSSSLQPHLEACTECRFHWQQQAIEHWASRMLQVPVSMVNQVTAQASARLDLARGNR